MQRELDAAVGPGVLSVEILGVNEVGQERDNEIICDGRTLPWLQDTADQNVWNAKWNVEWRDVVVLDSRNQRIAVYNLTANNLADPSKYAELKDLLRGAADARRYRPAVALTSPR
jgi:hypothetical protein